MMIILSPIYKDFLVLKKIHFMNAFDAIDVFLINYISETGFLTTIPYTGMDYTLLINFKRH